MEKKQIEMPKASMEREIKEENGKYTVSAKETISYTQEQLDEVYKSLVSTESNVAAQLDQITAQKEMFEKHAIPSLTERLDAIRKDKDQIRKHVSIKAKNFRPAAPQQQNVRLK